MPRGALALPIFRPSARWTPDPRAGHGLDPPRRRVDASRAAVYRALLDPQAVADWKVPPGMTSRVHSFEAREGGTLRISLSHDAPGAAGKTSAHTDTYHGRFVKLVANEQVVEVDEFETDDPQLQGEMTITITLGDAEGVSADDNELGWRLSLDKLAALVERG
jgi:uncharacterized protein YndB with AHSA1/START domain